MENRINNSKLKAFLKDQFTYNTVQVVTEGLLIALYVVLNRFVSINAWNMSIGFTFVPLAVAAILFGPIKAGLVGGLGDLIGALLFPFGPYFPGFTLTAFLKGIVFGVLLYKKANFIRIIISSAIVEFVLSLFLQSYWIYFLYGKNTYPIIVYTRIAQVLPLFIVEVIVITAISKTLLEQLKPYVVLNPKKTYQT